MSGVEMSVDLTYFAVMVSKVRLNNDLFPVCHAGANLC